MTRKTGLGSYTEKDLEKVSTEGEDGAKTPGTASKADAAKIQSDLDRYRDQMADDAPASGTQEDRG